MNAILNFLLILIGLFMFLSLPGLWLAWQPNVLVLILASGIGAGVIYMLLYPFSDLSKPGGHA